MRPIRFSHESSVRPSSWGVDAELDDALRAATAALDQELAAASGGGERVELQEPGIELCGVPRADADLAVEQLALVRLDQLLELIRVQLPLRQELVQLGDDIGEEGPFDAGLHSGSPSQGDRPGRVEA
jgi:hypothetical protein